MTDSPDSQAVDAIAAAIRDWLENGDPEDIDGLARIALEAMREQGWHEPHSGVTKGPSGMCSCEPQFGLSSDCSMRGEQDDCWCVCHDSHVAVLRAQLSAAQEQAEGLQRRLDHMTKLAAKKELRAETAEQRVRELGDKLIAAQVALEHRDPSDTPLS